MFKIYRLIIDFGVGSTPDKVKKDCVFYGDKKEFENKIRELNSIFISETFFIE
jgi:hypothetical protein